MVMLAASAGLLCTAMSMAARSASAGVVDRATASRTASATGPAGRSTGPPVDAAGVCSNDVTVEPARPLRGSPRPLGLGLRRSAGQRRHLRQSGAPVQVSGLTNVIAVAAGGITVSYTHLTLPTKRIV